MPILKTTIIMGLPIINERPPVPKALSAALHAYSKLPINMDAMPQVVSAPQPKPIMVRAEVFKSQKKVLAAPLSAEKVAPLILKIRVYLECLRRGRVFAEALKFLSELVILINVLTADGYTRIPVQELISMSEYLTSGSQSLLQRDPNQVPRLHEDALDYLTLIVNEYDFLLHTLPVEVHQQANRKSLEFIQSQQAKNG